MTNFAQRLNDYSSYFNSQLKQYFPLPAGPQKRVIEAMYYSLSAGGKRLRPFLVSTASSLFNIPKEQSLSTAIALECIHTYSLIHDDLPAMDDDNWRRGFPTCHRQFDEATAILAGDGLLTYAFKILSDPQTSPDLSIRLQLINMLSQASGAFNGMVAGQMLDLTPQEAIATEDIEQTIKQIEEMKTGCLIRFACEAGAVLANATQPQRHALVNYSRNIGIAFQITDDILDLEGDPQIVGKTLGKDNAQNKMTFTSLYGIENAKKIARNLISEAKAELEVFTPCEAVTTLSELADFIIYRNK